MQSLCQGKGQRSHKAKNRRKHFRGEFGRAISNLVAVLVSDLQKIEEIYERVLAA